MQSYLPTDHDMIGTMNDLPDPASSAGNQPIITNNPIIQTRDTQDSFGVPAGSVNKEIDVGGIRSGEVPGIKEVGKDIDLPKEVVSAGVKVQPTTVSIPPNVTKLGVKPIGPAVTPPQSQAVALPLTDDQIVFGLKQSVTSSWRWLAEWCVRKIRQLHAKIRKN